MEKINLNTIASHAREMLICKEKEKAQNYVESQLIPILLETAEQGRFFADISVPADQNIDLVLKILVEKVECKISRSRGMLNIIW